VQTFTDKNLDKKQKVNTKTISIVVICKCHTTTSEKVEVKGNAGQLVIGSVRFTCRNDECKRDLRDTFAAKIPD
jgi:hypothetical protein